jgi:hypothetical protein
MLHKNAANPTAAVSPQSPHPTQNPAGLTLVMPPSKQASSQPSPLFDLAVITARRCSAFFAEAAVLVVVFGILDFFILKGRIDMSWIVRALAISLSLLGASIAMDFSAHRWIKAHP